MFTRAESIKTLAWIWLVALCIAGCAGPAGIRLTRKQYNDTVKHTNEQELLLNLVRLRYNDAPQFIGVNAITAQFAADASAGLSAEVDDRIPRYFGTGDVIIGDRPTISYVPVQGPKFAQSLLQPLSLETLALLWEFNWDAETLFRLAVESFNSLDNASEAGGPITPRASRYDPSFRAMLALTKYLRQQQWIGLVVAKKPKVVSTVTSAAVPMVLSKMTWKT